MSKLALAITISTAQKMFSTTSIHSFWFSNGWPPSAQISRQSCFLLTCTTQRSSCFKIKTSGTSTPWHFPFSQMWHPRSPFVPILSPLHPSMLFEFTTTFALRQTLKSLIGVLPQHFLIICSTTIGRALNLMVLAMAHASAPYPWESSVEKGIENKKYVFTSTSFRHSSSKKCH